MLSNDNDDCSSFINFITYVDFKSPNSCSIYILIVVDAIVQNLHLSCYTTWKKSPWEGFVTKDYKYRMWFNNISFKKSKLFIYTVRKYGYGYFLKFPFLLENVGMAMIEISSYHILNSHQNHKAVHIRWRKYITKYEIFSPSRLFDFRIP